MTGYGRGETDHDGTKFTVELNSVNRKQSDVVINLPRDLVELEPRIRQTINENISRGRTNATVSLHSGANGARNLALNTELARSYHEASQSNSKKTQGSSGTASGRGQTVSRSAARPDTKSRAAAG
jgi:uncharacterized protein (TIGR00255 family)